MAVAGLVAAAAATGLILSDSIRSLTAGSATPPAPSAAHRSHVHPPPGVGHARVAVLNTWGGTGAAGDAAAELRGRGVRVTYVGDGTFTSRPTRVLYRSGFHRRAKALAKNLHLPPPAEYHKGLEPAIGNAQVIVLVGPGGLS